MYRNQLKLMGFVDNKDFIYEFKNKRLDNPSLPIVAPKEEKKSE